MDFTTLKQSLADAGFDDLSAAQQSLLINDAVREVDEAFNWPYRETTITGAAPLTISDLGEIDTVIDATSTPLEEMARRELIRLFGDITTTGTPIYYYRDTLTGTLKIATYPVTSANITVRYYKQAATLSAGSDTPAAPARFHSIYVAVARREAYRRFRGDMPSASAEQGFINNEIGLMAGSLMMNVGNVHVPLVGDDS